MNLNSSIIRITERTLNFVDPRLMNHGRRVSYLIYRALRERGGHTLEEIRRLSLLGLLHDIGAYKSEEVDDMIRFESDHVWSHSIYGYLFIKHFSPLSAFAPAILFHHADCAELSYLHPSLRPAAQMLHAADRFDFLLHTGGNDPDRIREHFKAGLGTEFMPEIVEMFFYNGWENTMGELESDSGFQKLVYDSYMPHEDLRAYLEMLVLSIDFRSPQTVTHTIAASCACQLMSRIIGLSRDDEAQMHMGVMLHDIGKVGVPLSILENPGGLDEADKEIMKRHVTHTAAILEGLVSERCLHLAARHHEKLDGSGYPLGLDATELSKGQRLVAVADIFSALTGKRSYKDSFGKERVLGIMREMCGQGAIDPDIVNAFETHYDYIAAETARATEPVSAAYEKIRREMDFLSEYCLTFKDGLGNGQFRHCQDEAGSQSMFCTIIPSPVERAWNATN